MAIRVISSDERQSRRAQMSVARRVTRRFRSTARRARRCVPAVATRFAIGPGARNAACVTFTTGCWFHLSCSVSQTMVKQCDPSAWLF